MSGCDHRSLRIIKSTVLLLLFSCKSRVDGFPLIQQPQDLASTAAGISFLTQDSVGSRINIRSLGSMTRYPSTNGGNHLQPHNVVTNTIRFLSRNTQTGNSRGRQCRKSTVGDIDEITEYDKGDSQTVVFADYMATCVPGMAQILADEIQMLGGQQVQLSGTSAVYFRVPDRHPTTILTILLWCRTAHKILELLCRTTEPVYTRDDIYEWVRNTVPANDLLLNPNFDNSNNGSDKKKWLTLSVSVTLNNAMYIPSDINHSHYTALNIKNALVDAARVTKMSSSQDHPDNRQSDADRPSVDITENCDVPLVVMIRGIPSSSSSSYSGYNSNNNDRSRYYTSNGRNVVDQQSQQPTSGGAQLSLFRCIHGTGSLHRRGYRSNAQIHKAALKESTAAALLYAAQWHIKCRQRQQGVQILMDPMMGSGTFLIEGAMMAADIAPGLMRIKCGITSSQSPPILRWKRDIDDTTSDERIGSKTEPIQTIWNQLLMDATQRAQRGIDSLRQQRPNSGGGSIQIIGNDISNSAYQLAEMAFQQAGLRNVVQIYNTDCAVWKPTITTTTTTIGTNKNCSPTWTIVSNPPWGVRLSEDMDISWEALRTFLRSDTSIVPKRPVVDDDEDEDDGHDRSTEVWILSGNAELTKHLGLRRSQCIPLQTGEQQLRWLQYILRPPGSMNRRTTDNGADEPPKFIKQSTEQNDVEALDVDVVDKEPFNHRGDERNLERNQNQINYRSTNRAFSDREYSTSYRPSSLSYRRSMTVPDGTQRRQESFRPLSQKPERGRRRPEQQSRQRKVKTPATPDNKVNEWLI